MLPLLRNPRVYLAAGLLAFVGIGAAAYYWWPRQPPLPERDSPVYQEYQRAFQVGVAAMDAKNEEHRVRPKLERAIEIVPGEPAAWANLGLFHLRNNDLKQAADNLKRARELA